MNCTQAHKLLHDHARGTLDKTTSACVESHIQQCPDCAEKLQDFKSIFPALKTMPVPVNSPEYWNQMHSDILARIKGPQNQQISAKKSPAFSLFAAKQKVHWAVAALLVLSVISLSLLITLTNRSGPIITETVFPRVIQLHGNVFTDNSNNLLRSDKQLQLVSGTTLRTSEQSSVLLQTDSNSTIEIIRNSDIVLLDCTEKKQSFKLNEGELVADVGKRMPGQVFKIETPNARCLVVGTRFRVSTQSDPLSLKTTTILSVYEGRVQFDAGGKTVSVDAGYSISALEDSIGVQSRIHPVSSSKKETAATFKRAESKRLTKKQKRTIDSGCEKIADAETNSEKQLLLKALSYIDSGKINQALHELEKIYQNESHSAEARATALRKASLCYSITRQFEKSIQMLERILSSPFPGSLKESALYELISIQNTRLHDYESAIRNMKRYLDTYPSGIWSEEVHFSLAELFYLRKEYQAAAEVYDSVLRKFHQSSRTKYALYSLARIHSRDLQDCAKSLPLFSRIQSDFPESDFAEDALFWKADCLYRMGRITQAIAEYATYLKRYPQGKWAAEASLRSNRTETAGAQR